MCLAELLTACPRTGGEDWDRVLLIWDVVDAPVLLQDEVVLDEVGPAVLSSAAVVLVVWDKVVLS